MNVPVSNVVSRSCQAGETPNVGLSEAPIKTFPDLDSSCQGQLIV
jgi:hypothetical protein